MTPFETNWVHWVQSKQRFTNFEKLVIQIVNSKDNVPEKSVIEKIGYKIGYKKFGYIPYTICICTQCTQCTQFILEKIKLGTKLGTNFGYKNQIGYKLV